MLPQRGVDLSSSAGDDLRSEQAYLTTLYGRLDSLRAHPEDILIA